MRRQVTEPDSHWKTYKKMEKAKRRLSEWADKSDTGKRKASESPWWRSVAGNAVLAQPTVNKTNELCS